MSPFSAPRAIYLDPLVPLVQLPFQRLHSICDYRRIAVYLRHPRRPIRRSNAYDHCPRQMCP
ncbi:hypothetical protein B0H10DRAFT_1998926 [Mycena sp. CBHHK59/15]|nr:hypothetical protein B0H10DRAFT_1998926 [Mycena sp. CBHHK59/15]